LVGAYTSAKNQGVDLKLLKLTQKVHDLSLDKEALQSVIEKTDGARSDEGICRAHTSEVCLDRAPALQRTPASQQP
jgi:hypothetical protein